ncbi:MAG TPA: hypothetical protein PLM98_04595 [Thiolinea sp.]|nr:hypothetical protein [Thiolinea sp.]
MFKLTKLSLTLLGLVCLSYSLSLVADESATLPAAIPSASVATPEPNVAAKTAPDIAGVYRLAHAERTLLEAKQDPLKGFYVFKGKLEIERLDENTFLVFEAQTVKNSGTMHYVSIFEFMAGEFKKKLVHRENAVFGDVQIDTSPEGLIIKTTERNEFAETLTWKRIDPSQELKDKYLEKHIAQAKKEFEDYGLDRYKALRVK